MRLSLLSVAALLAACDTSGQVSSPDVEALAARLDAMDAETTAGFAAAAEEVATLQARVAELEGAAAEDEARIAALEAQVETLELGVGELDAAVEAVLASGDLLALVDAVNAFETRVSALESAGFATEAWVESQGYGSGGGDTTALEARVSATESSLSALSTEVADATSSVTTLQGTVTSLAADVSGVQSDLTTIDADLTAIDAELAGFSPYVTYLDDLSAYVEVDAAADTVTFAGANVYVTNGAGSTASTNGLGNLVVGYAESAGDTRSGSHMLVLGAYHGWTGYGGIVAGYDNDVSGAFASVLGGGSNSASGAYATVVGGQGQSATDAYSSTP